MANLFFSSLLFSEEFVQSSDKDGIGKPKRPWACFSIKGNEALIVPLSSNESFNLGNAYGFISWARASEACSSWAFSWRPSEPSLFAWNEAQWVSLIKLQRARKKPLSKKDCALMVMAAVHDLEIKGWASSKMRRIMDGIREVFFKAPHDWEAVKAISPASIDQFPIPKKSRGSSSVVRKVDQGWKEF